MSYLMNEDILCPFCQFPNPAEYWSFINVKDDPELKDLLVGGELNLIECDSCHEFFYVDRFLIYHDSDRELMAFVYTLKDSENKSLFEAKTHDDFKTSQSHLSEKEKINYSPLTFFGLDELLRLVEAEEESFLQCEILKYEAETWGLNLKTLTPSQARSFKVPVLLPYTGSSFDRGSLVAGLSRVLEKNETLSVFRSLKEKIEVDSLFEIPQ